MNLYMVDLYSSQSLFNSFLLPVMGAKGYEGILDTKKNARVKEGCAIFYKTSRFSLERRSSVCLTNAFLVRSLSLIDGVVSSTFRSGVP